MDGARGVASFGLTMLCWRTISGIMSASRPFSSHSGFILQFARAEPPVAGWPRQLSECAGGFILQKVCEECGSIFDGSTKQKRCSRVCYGNYRSRVIRGETHPTYKGLIDRDGYLARFVPGHPMAGKDGYVLEHRRVVFDAGIEIPDGCHVHHKNHIRKDNRLENLAVMTESEHHSHHTVVGMTVVNQYGVWAVHNEEGRKQAKLRQLEKHRQWMANNAERIKEYREHYKAGVRIGRGKGKRL